MTAQILVISGIQNGQEQAPIWQAITDTASETTPTLTAKLVACQNENELLNALASATHNYAGVIIDTGNITYTGQTLHQAIAQCILPCINVCMSHDADSALSSACEGVISGFGVAGYNLAMAVLCQHMQQLV